MLLQDSFKFLSSLNSSELSVTLVALCQSASCGMRTQTFVPLWCKTPVTLSQSETADCGLRKLSFQYGVTLVE